MRFYDISFFGCEDLRVHFRKLEGHPESYTIIINAKESSYHSPKIILHIDSIKDVINFKNEVIWAYESFIKLREVTKL